MRRVRLIALGALLASFGAVLSSPAAAAPPTATPPPARGRQVPAPPPPPPSVPPVTRAEADALFASLADAWKREDVETLVRLHDAPLQAVARANAQRIFSKSNYFTFAVRVESERTREDGALELTAATDLESRAVTDPWPRREKRRWTIGVARRPGAGVVIADQEPAEAGLLPANPPWRNASVRGEVRLDGLATRAGRAQVRVVLDVLNAGAEATDDVAFALHPFASEFVARAGDRVLTARRTEASIDAWHVTLPEALAPGASLELSLDYRLEQPGDIASSAIGPDLVRLYSASAWLPLIEPARGDVPPVRRHDLTVVLREGMEASMPGTRTALPDPAPGLRAVRFVSDIPSREIPLVATTGRREEIRLGPSLILDVLHQRDGADATLSISHVTTLAAFLEDRLGACPVGRIALVEGGGDAFREAPAWMALPGLKVPADDAMRPDGNQYSFFLGLAMSRLWVMHERAPRGIGARDVALGLCEHLLGDWMGAVVDRSLPQRQRDELLSYVRLDPQLDRPLLPLAIEQPAPRIFKAGKARMVFDMYEMLAGADAWRDVLLRWRHEVPAGASIDELVRLMGGTREKDAFLDAFLRRQGACQLTIHDVRVEPLTAEELAPQGLDPDAWHAVVIEIDNAGIGPVPLELQVQVDGAFRTERTLVPEAGRATVRFAAGSRPARVHLDPARVLWQGGSDDDRWPLEKPKKRRNFGAVSIGARDDASRGEVRDPGP